VELADLVRTKEEVIKTLQSKLAEAKKKIGDLKAEVQKLRSSHRNEPQQPQQQQQWRASNRVATHSLPGIHQCWCCGSSKKTSAAWPTNFNWLAAPEAPCETLWS